MFRFRPKLAVVAIALGVQVACASSSGDEERVEASSSAASENAPVTLAPIESAIVDSKAPSTPSPSVYVVHHAGTTDRQTYLKFDVGSVRTAIDKAVVRFTVVSLPDGRPAPMLVSSTTNDWSPKAINFNNKPKPLAQLTGVMIDGSYPKQLPFTIELDVTAYVKSVVNGRAMSTPDTGGNGGNGANGMIGGVQNPDATGGTATKLVSIVLSDPTAACKTIKLTPVVLVVTPTPPVCGDGTCNASESCSTCSKDCGSCAPVCGDGVCNPGETCSTCTKDCGTCAPVCGDGVCSVGETCSTCTKDCGTCAPVCGDGVCSVGETCSTCTKDCGACAPVCGDGVCSAGETCGNCAKDCGTCAPVCDATCTGSGFFDTEDQCRNSKPNKCVNCIPKQACCGGGALCVGPSNERVTCWKPVHYYEE